jgi:hypothetical protein
MKFDPTFLDSLALPKTRRMVRIGCQHDGGYVMADDFEGITQALSFGVGNNWSFDSDLASRGVVVHMFDHTIGTPSIDNANLRFWAMAWQEPYDGLSIMPDDGNDGILKFDVEGCEWSNLRHVQADELKRFRHIVGEFHDMENQFDGDVIAKLTTHHKLIHVHGNNYGGTFDHDGKRYPRVVEMTFLRIDRDEFETHPGPLPGPLDSPNAWTMEDIEIIR